MQSLSQQRTFALLICVSFFLSDANFFQVCEVSSIKEFSKIDVRKYDAVYDTASGEYLVYNPKCVLPELLIIYQFHNTKDVHILPENEDVSVRLGWRKNWFFWLSGDPMVILSHPKTVCSLTFTRYVVAFMETHVVCSIAILGAEGAKKTRTAHQNNQGRVFQLLQRY